MDGGCYATAHRPDRTNIATVIRSLTTNRAAALRKRPLGEMPKSLRPFNFAVVVAQNHFDYRAFDPGDPDGTFSFQRQSDPS
jgi:hypothetical protein